MKKKRRMQFFAMIIMIMGILNVLAFKSIPVMATEIVDSGTCGKNLTWTFDTQGVLTISGEGAMTDYSTESLSPWNDYSNSITSIVISENVSGINENAFKNCTELLWITVADGNEVYHSVDNCLIETESKNLIKGCANSVIPSDGSVTNISSYAFYKCSGLTSIIIPNSVTSIGKYAFNYCPNIESIQVGKLNGSYHSYNNCLILTAKKELILGCLNSSIPEDGTVTKIGDAAFANCQGLLNITIPNQVTEIVANAFSGCISLEEIDIPTSISSIGMNAFENCTQLQQITIPSNVKTLENNVFMDCTSLETVTIHSETINDRAFGGCTGIKSISFGSKTNSIAYTAFMDCVNLENINVDSNNSAFFVEGNCLIQKDYPVGYASGNVIIIGCNSSEIPDSVIGVGAYAFYGRTGFSDIEGVSTLRYIGSDAFNGCTSLEGVMDVSLAGILYGVGPYAFNGCTGLNGIILGDGVKVAAFYNCPNIKSVYITSLYTGSYSLSNVIDLTGVETIEVNEQNDDYYSEGNCVLEKKYGSDKCDLVLGCKNSVIPPENVVYIEANAFKGCAEMQSIAIPSCVTGIAATAFSGCENLSDIYFGDTESRWETISKNVAEELSNVTVHYNSPEKMQTGVCGDGVSWTLTTDCILTISGDGEMEDYSAWSAVPWSEERLGIEKVVIQEGVTSISDYAFFGCQSLVSVSIPMSVKRIGDVAFYDCPKMTDVYYGGNELHWNLIEIGEENSLLSNVNIHFAIAETPGHVLGEWEIVKEASCTEAGKEERVCKYCDYTESREVEATGHAYEDVITEATCEETGYTTHTCSVCGDSYVDREVEAIGHTYEDVITEATCEESGYTTHTCSVCGDSYVDREVEAIGHTYEDVITEATCEETGYTTHTCSVCGDSYVDSEVEALGHELGEWTTTKEAGCEEAGGEKRSCERCNHFETKEVPATGHAYEEEVTEPTCEESGYTTHTCSVCGDSYADSEVEALGHKLGEWITTKETTCEEAGEEQSSCDRCGYVETKVISATGHTYETVVTVPTCEESGYSTHTCSVCGDSYVDSEVEALGHSFTNYISDNNATTDSAGTLTAKCDRCDATDTIPDPAGPIVPEVPKNDEVIRLSGTTRYETGYKVADVLKERLGVDQFDAVVIATGKNFADALSGSYLAVVKNAPIILTNGKDANIATLHDYIKENVVEGGKIYILGGTGAVPASVEAIEGYDVVRLSGPTRYDTNLAILKEAGIAGDELIVATGKSFADSLSASAAKLPILLVKPGEALSDKAKAVIEGMNKIYIIGGEGAVSKDIEDELAVYGEVERVFGKSRYETSIAVANTFFEDIEEVVIASGKNFPDGLCGGPLAAVMDAPLILTADGKTSAAVDYVQGESVESGFILGGTGAIGDDSVVEIIGLESADEIILK